MRRVVSVSLGSASGDHMSKGVFLGEEFLVERIGTNGDMKRYAELIRELDGKVDAITLGGIDRYLVAGGKKYTIRDAERLASNAKKTPIVDGSGIKNTLERKTIEYLQEQNIIDFSNKKVLMMASVDRFGMGEAISMVTRNVIYGDLLFSLGVPIPVRSWSTVTMLGKLLLPIVCALPFQWFYPTGEKQDKTTPKHEKYFAWADVVAGDRHIITRFMPTPESGAMKGKIVITNTLTKQVINNLKDRGVDTVVTSTYDIEGRTFGTNALEGVMITLAGKRAEEMTNKDYDVLIEKLGWKPTIKHLQEIE